MKDRSAMSAFELERLLHHMPAVASQSDGFLHDFARSILRQSRRRNWRPSTKQALIMRQAVADLFVEDRPVIEPRAER
jgi:hypothetical protein